jgi:hypothetical protein
VGRGFCGQSVKIGSPYGLNNPGLSKLDRKSVSDMRNRMANLFLKEDSSVIRDWIAFLNIDAVFFWSFIPRLGASIIQPTLDLCAHGWQ